MIAMCRIDGAAKPYVCRFVLGLLGTIVGVAAIETWAASDPFVADCRQLTRDDHRLSGTTEFHRASHYIENRLHGMGLKHVLVQEYPTTQTNLKRCQIDLGDSVLPLQPMRPNGIVPPVTPPEGVRGPLYDAGAGRPEDFRNRSPKGCIVVMDYNCGQNWLQALRMGAKAIIFVANGPAQAWHFHFVENNANFLRLYYAGERSDLPEGVEATIHSEIVWEPTVGRNVLAFIPGRSPEFHLETDEMIVLATHLDSFGEVPRLAPGARGAANAAGLLKLAATLQDHQPKRHILLAFFDGQARCHTGTSIFYRLFDKSVKLDEYQTSFKREQRFLDQMSQVLATNQPLRQESELKRELFLRVKSKAREHVYEINDRLKKERLRPNEDRSRIADLDKDKEKWNDLMRALARDRFSNTESELDEEVEKRASIALKQVSHNVEMRKRELAVEGRALELNHALKSLVGDHWISLHISLLVGDRTSRWGLAIGGGSALHSRHKDKPGVYLRTQGAFLKIWKQLGATDGLAADFEPASADGSLNPPNLLFAGPRLIHSGEVAGGLGYYNLAFCTVHEDQRREGTPDDRLELLNLDRMEPQFDQMATMLGALADSPGLSQRSSIESQYATHLGEFKADNRAHGLLAMGRSPGSSVPNKPMPGVTIQLYPYREWYRTRFFAFQRKKIYAFDDHQVLRTNQNGSYQFGPVNWKSGIAKRIHWTALGFDERGVATYSSTRAAEESNQERLNMFKGRGGAVVCPPSLNIRRAQVIDARTNGILDKGTSHFLTQDGVIRWFCEEMVKGIKLFGTESVVALNNGEEELELQHETLRQNGSYQGRGLPVVASSEPFFVTRRAASDLWRLNEARMQILRKKGVSNSSVEELHGRSEDLLFASAKPGPVSTSSALAASAFMAERPVYSDVRGTFDDLVYTVLVLLGLSVPFAFALERLAVGSTSIYRQIFWFVLIFVLTFVILFFTHPAFTISKTPMVIFLGFTVLVLSSLVIVIIMRKFEVELKVLQGLTSTVHAVDVSRFGTVIAAMSMGISTMRRRPLRTALTAITIILLTFTILCFASFDTHKGIIRLHVMSSPPYAGVFVHQVAWGELDENLLQVIRGRWGQQQNIRGICPRYWRSSAAETGPLISRADGSRPLALRGVLGLTSQELTFRSELAGLLGTDSTNTADTVWMTQAVANRLGVTEGDRVLAGGLTLRIGRLLDAVQLSVAKDMDDSDVLPVDPGQMDSSVDVAGDPMSMADRQNWASLPVDSVILVDAAMAARLGATLRAISIYVDEPTTAIQIAEDLARILPMPISATRHDGVYRHLLSTTLHASGAASLLIPILLGGLVIFGTMLGSVADREREIYTFSALGLAPPHVAGLFFAEAMVYSVIGGLGGYLLAQGSTKILSLLTAYGIVRVPEMNYSSTNAVVTLLIVMGTVLISAIYPAIKASRSANPGILRTWRLAQPQGDVFNLVFPFTVSEYDITGVVSFIKEHFDNFADTGLGIFMARDAHLIGGENHKVGLGAHLALAPFDLGVTQSFELHSTPSEIPGIDEVKILITRKSGQPKDWRRLNKILLDDLRRQFLIWRSLPQDTMEIYRNRTLTETSQWEDDPLNRPAA